MLGHSGWRVALQPDLAQLCSFLFFGCAVYEVLQEPGSESVALHIQYRAGTIAGEGCMENDFNNNSVATCEQKLWPTVHEMQRLCTYTSQSTAKMREMSVVGSPTASRMIARVRTPPAGIPAAPTLEAVAVTLTHYEGK